MDPTTRGRQRKPSLPRERALWREDRNLLLLKHGVPPSRDCRPGVVWPPPHGGGRPWQSVLKLSCGVSLLASTSVFPINVIAVSAQSITESDAIVTFPARNFPV